MEHFPTDLLKLLNIYLCDTAFISLKSTSKLFYNLQNDIKKVLRNQYKITKIRHLLDVYNFTDIRYDLLEWDINLISPTIEKIKFKSKFNENFKELFYNFPNLRVIDIGIFYTNKAILYENYPEHLNMNKLSMTIMTNKIFERWLASDIKMLNNNSKNHYPEFIKIMSELKQYENKYKNMSYTEFTQLSPFEAEIIKNTRNLINRMSKYESQFSYVTNTTITEEQFKFLKFCFCFKLKSNILKLSRKISRKFGYKDFNEYLKNVSDVKTNITVHNNKNPVNTKRRLRSD